MSDDKTADAPRKRKKDVVSDWREANIQELDRNLAVWRAIRDDPDASDKDRIEAGKSIARQLGALSPDAKKTEKEEARENAPTKPRLKDTHAKELEELLAHL